MIRMVKQNARKIFKVFTFLLIGSLIFGILQHIFVPKRFPYAKSYDAGKLKYFYNEKGNDIDVAMKIMYRYWQSRFLLYMNRSCMDLRGLWKNIIKHRIYAGNME